MRVGNIFANTMNLKSAWADVLHHLLPQCEITFCWFLLWPSHCRVVHTLWLTLEHAGSILRPVAVRMVGQEDDLQMQANPVELTYCLPVVPPLHEHQHEELVPLLWESE